MIFLTELQEKLIDNLLEVINDEIKKLKEENKEIKSVISYFINGYEKDKNTKEVTLKHVCEYTMMINEFQQWLEKEKEILYRDYGYTQQAMTKCYEKLIEIRKKYEE